MLSPPPPANDSSRVLNCIKLTSAPPIHLYYYSVYGSPPRTAHGRRAAEACSRRRGPRALRELRMGMAAPRGGPCPLPPLQEPAVVPRRIPSRAAGAAQGTEGLACIHPLKGGLGMEPAHVGAVHPLSSRCGATAYAQRLPRPHQTSAALADEGTRRSHS